MKHDLCEGIVMITIFVAILTAFGRKNWQFLESNVIIVFVLKLCVNLGGENVNFWSKYVRNIDSV
jgi:hypothetical protein